MTISQSINQPITNLQHSCVSVIVALFVKSTSIFGSPGQNININMALSEHAATWHFVRILWISKLCLASELLSNVT